MFCKVRPWKSYFCNWLKKNWPTLTSSTTELPQNIESPLLFPLTEFQKNFPPWKSWSWPGLKTFCNVYYQPKVHRKYFRLMAKAWKYYSMGIISHNNIYLLYKIMHFRENIFWVIAWLENILQFLFSGKAVWRSDLKAWFQVNKNFRFFSCNLHHKKNWV